MVPSDGCPHRRPFSAQFSECPFFEAVQFEVTNMRDVPIASIWTCRQLEVGDYPGERGHHYAKCHLGDLAGRRHVLLERLRQPWVAA